MCTVASSTISWRFISVVAREDGELDNGELTTVLGVRAFEGWKPSVGATLTAKPDCKSFVLRHDPRRKGRISP